MKKIIETGIKKISRTLSSSLKIVRNIDYKILSLTIFNIQSSKTPEDALNHLSEGLRKILDYRIFAFFIHGAKKNSVMAWIEPEYYEKHMKKIFEEDSGLSGAAGLVYVTLKKTEEDHSCFDEINIGHENTRLFRIALPHLDARIYLTPGRFVLPYHMEIIHILIESLKNAISLQFEIEQLRQEAALDSLTGISNRGDFERQISHAAESASRYRKNLSMFIFDIDDFKNINDTFGHQAGDTVLKSIAETVKNNIRSCDIFARYGGEEFVVVLPETSVEMASELAERIRIKISGSIISSSGFSGSVTASFGVSALSDGMQAADLVRLADENMYAAKRNGKNRIFPETGL